jgi:hypothetical protein
MTIYAPTASFLHGALSMACLVAGVLFLTYWRNSRDRLFVFFAAAFWALGLNWAVLGLINPLLEHRHWVHALRLLAFALIAFAIIDKNRTRPRGY